MANAPGALELLPSHLYPPGWLKIERDLGDGRVETLFSLPKPEGGDPYKDIYMQRDAWWRMVDPKLLDPAKIGGNSDEGYTSELAWKKFIERMHKVKMFHENFLSERHYHKPSHYFFAEKTRTYSTVRWRLPPIATRLEREAIHRARPCSTEGRGSCEIVVTQRDAMAGKVVDGNMHYGTEWRIPAILQGPDGAGDGTVPVESAKAPAEAIAHGVAADEHPFDHEAAYKEVLPQIYTLLATCKLAGSLPQ